MKTLSERNRKKFAPILVLFCIIITVVYSSHDATAQQRAGRRSKQGRGDQTQLRQDDRGQQARQAQAEKRQQAIENAAEAIDAGLVDMLNLVNQQQRPGKNKLASTQEAVQKGRKYIKQFQDNMACQFLMLSAWTDYFEAGAEKALSPATQAYRKDHANNDAHATQTAIAVLAGNKPFVIRPKRQQAQANEITTSRKGGGRTGRSTATGQQTRGRSRGQDTSSRRGRGPGGTGPGADYASGTTGTFSGTVSSGNILNLNADSIKADWLGRKVGQFSLNCLNGTSFAYNPDEANLCILFWKLAAADLADHGVFEDTEPDNIIEIPKRTAPVPQRPSYSSRPGMEHIGGRFGGRMPPGRQPGFYDDETTGKSDPVSVQISALGNLFNSKFQDPDVKFIAVNTSNPRTAPAVVAKLLQSPWPWAQAMLDESTANTAFSDLDIKKVISNQPVLAVVDKTGTVRYAGSASGFLAPMVLNELLSGRTAPRAGYGSQQIESDGAGTEPQVPKTVTTAPDEPPQQTPDTTLATNQHITDRLVPPQGTEITPEDFQAQKLLAYAQGLFIPAGRKKFLTSKTGVDICRRIIREYPNTTYADEARKLLRTVPPNEQKRYDITPEEMGL